MMKIDALDDALAPAQTRWVQQPMTGRAVDIEILDQRSHAAYPFPLFGIRHGESPVQRLRALFD